MNPEAAHEFSVDFARDLKEYIDSLEQSSGAAGLGNWLWAMGDWRGSKQ